MAADPENITLGLNPTPDIDIVLSKSRTNVNLSNFERDIKNALARKGVDPSRINVSAIEAHKVNLADAFEWESDVSPSIGSISIINNGMDVSMYGNTTNPGKNAIWIIPETTEEQIFTMGYNLEFGDSFNAAGMLLKVRRTGDTLEGYMLSFNNSNWRSEANGSGGAIWKFTYQIGTNSSNMIKELKKSLDINTSGQLRVEVTEDEIIISGGGMSSEVVYEVEQQYGSGFGFFSDHYSHNCSRIGEFKLTGIGLETSTAKKFEQILREPDWREDSIKALVNVSDIGNKELNGIESLGNVLTRLINEPIHFIAWGNNTNQSQFTQLYQSNNNNGAFYNNSNYNNCIEQTATYIYNLLKNRESSNYVILNENTKVTIDPSSIMSGTADENFPNGKWKVIHEYDYYENNLGRFPKSNKYMDAMITEFNKVGRYEILYANRPITPQYVYVHRRPQAEFEIVRNGNRLTYISEAYDLDNYSNNRGIQEEKWSYKKVGATNWINGKLTTIPSGNADYIVQLQVKDFQNTWSTPVSKYVTNNTNAKPIATFKIKERNTSIYDPVEVIDGSYDPYGRAIAKWTWEVYKGSTRIYSGNRPMSDFSRYGTGTYTMALTVTNSAGIQSERFSRTINIISDENAPDAFVTPENCDWKQSITVNLSFNDIGGSGFKNYQYSISTDPNTPGKWSNKIQKQTDTLTINQDGILYLHIKTEDNAHNISEDVVFGPYHIDKTKPQLNTQTNPDTWVIDTTYIEWTASDNESGLRDVRMPDGTKIAEGSGTYPIWDNGTYTFIATDNVGNATTVEHVVNNFDKTPPVLNLSITPVTWDDTKVCIHWEASDSQSGFARIDMPDGNTSTDTTGDLIVEQIGIYTFIAYDNVGNQIEMPMDIGNIDKINPKLELAVDTEDWTNEDVYVSWEAEDFESGFREIVQPNGEISTEKTGGKYIGENGVYTYIAYDNVGNKTVREKNIQNIDKIPPRLQITTSNLENSTGNVEITWKADDFESGLREIVLPNGTCLSDKEGTFTIDEKGTYTIIAYDNAGNFTIHVLDIGNIYANMLQLEVIPIISEEQTVLHWKVTGTDDYKGIVLPDGNRSDQTEGDFPVAENGTYTFLAYDTMYNYVAKSVEIKHLQ